MLLRRVAGWNHTCAECDEVQTLTHTYTLIHTPDRHTTHDTHKTLYTQSDFPSAYSNATVYTNEDIQTIVQYGLQRGIRVVPELPLPGTHTHTRLPHLHTHTQSHTVLRFEPHTPARFRPHAQLGPRLSRSTGALPRCPIRRNCEFGSARP